MILPYFNIKKHPIYDFYDNIEYGGFIKIFVKRKYFKKNYKYF